MTFNQNFAWGAATAAYQIEGAHDADGKSSSVWDHMVRWPEKIHLGENGDIACDHYHRLEEDLNLMEEIGLNAYRFSFAWTRILPEGTGRPNEDGLAFYDRLIDGLLARNIQPWGTLFHWCYPMALYRKGGWLNDESSEWFCEYATVIAKRYGDRIQNWITLNEPQMFIHLGHHIGCHAPGLQLPQTDIARCIHHVLLAHGKASLAIREHASAEPTIGWAPAVGISSVDPEYTSDPEVVSHAKEGHFQCNPDSGNLANGSSIWCDPVFLKKYPENFLLHYGNQLPADWEKDLETIATPIDFCGMNIYAAWGQHTRDENGDLAYRPESTFGEGFPRTLFGWPLTPEALYWGPVFFKERYNIPIVITENGMSGHDWVSLDGKVHDPQRIDFTARYLSELKRAAKDGVDIRGYFHWSLMDNFEWAEGYKHRFGLIHVDYPTGTRTLKDSAGWYRSVIETNGASLP